MPRIPETGLDARLYLYDPVPLHRPEVPEADFSILLGVKRGYVGFGQSPVFSRLPFSIHLLNVSRVQQHDLAELRRGWGSDDVSCEAIFYEPWNSPTVIDMSMSKEKGSYLSRVKAPILPVALFHPLSTLKETAIHKDLLTLGALDEKIGPGYSSCAA
jgi:hypothetical protein